MNANKNILIVEDETFTAMNLRLSLEKAGYHVCGILATGEQAVITAIEKHPDIILMDIHLAGEIDGIEAAKQISKKQQVTLIFMSGYETSEMAARTANIKSAKYFTKPVDINDIISVFEV